MKKYLALMAFSILALGTGYAQDDKKKLEQDFERFKQDREHDYQNFVKKREAELKKMEQEYLNYYNQMMGLKNEYVKSGEPEKAEVVQDMIDYENTIANSLNYKIPERLKISPSASENAKIDPKPQPESPTPVSEKIELNKSNDEVPETTLKADPKQRDGIPVLTPLPSKSAKITSPFGVRIHPTLGRPIKHNGVDFGSGRGTEVFAASSGRVVLAEYNRSYGNYIIIEHQEGTSSVYAHLDRLVVGKGTRVKKGELIGYTGSTGRTTGAHLHYEVRIKGIPVDPKGYLIEYLK